MGREKEQADLKRELEVQNKNKTLLPCAYLPYLSSACAKRVPGVLVGALAAGQNRTEQNRPPLE